MSRLQFRYDFEIITTAGGKGGVVQSHQYQHSTWTSRLPYSSIGPNKIKWPTCIAPLTDGNLAVTDDVEVKVISPSGTFIITTEMSGAREPCGIAKLSCGKVAVS